MNYTIKNENLTVVLKSFGGELHSIQDASGTEYLWQADPKYWAGQAPVLFPCVGSLTNNEAPLKNGKTAVMGRHGFIRKMEFDVVDQKEEELTFSIRSNEETKKNFPFDFEVQITYALSGNTVTTSYRVINTGNEILPFTIGGHPAFNCPIWEGEAFEDYELRFGAKETASVPAIDMVKGTIDVTDRTSILQNQDQLPLNHHLFDKDALVFEDLSCKSVAIAHKETGKGIRLDYPQMQFIGIWSALGDAPFVALEPWNGMAGRSDESGVFEEKIGVKELNPGEEAVTGFDIVVIS